MIDIKDRDNLRSYVENSWIGSNGDEILKILDSLEHGGLVKDSVGNYGVAGDRVKVTLPNNEIEFGVVRYSDESKEFLVTLDTGDNLYLGFGWAEIKEFEFIKSGVKIYIVVMDYSSGSIKMYSPILANNSGEVIENWLSENTDYNTSHCYYMSDTNPINITYEDKDAN
jgi:hypothetical protein